jgi:hypothetical protein
MYIQDEIHRAHENLLVHQNSLIGDSYQQALDLLKSWSSDLKNRFPKGEWKTINGAKVFVNEGKVVAGLDGFNKEIDKFFAEKKSKSSVSVFDKYIKSEKSPKYSPILTINGESFDTSKLTQMDSINEKTFFSHQSDKDKIKNAFGSLDLGILSIKKHYFENEKKNIIHSIDRLKALVDNEKDFNTYSEGFTDGMPFRDKKLNAAHGIATIIKRNQTKLADVNDYLNEINETLKTTEDVNKNPDTIEIKQTGKNSAKDSEGREYDLSIPNEPVPYQSLPYTLAQIDRAKRRYNEFMQIRPLQYFNPYIIGQTEAYNRMEHHNAMVKDIKEGDRQLEKKWKYFFLKEEYMADQKAAEEKEKKAANKTASDSILAPIKKLKKLGDFGKWLNTSGNPYRKQHFSKKYSQSAVDAYLKTLQ